LRCLSWPFLLLTLGESAYCPDSVGTDVPYCPGSKLGLELLGLLLLTATHGAGAAPVK
jgi:hypothetical protein